jgi:hydrogenase maturation protease
MLPGQADIEFIDGGTLSFTLVEAIEAAEKLIVIDAAELRCVPGMVRLFQGEEMDGFVGTSKKSSVHEVSLADLLVISHLTGHLPKYRALIGIQPGTIVWSETLSEPVDKAIRSAYELISELLLEWRTAGGAIARRQDPSA